VAILDHLANTHAPMQTHVDPSPEWLRLQAPARNVHPAML
jgi:hypothetical protein